MKYFSMFSGIGGFEVGIHSIYKDTAICVGFSEINKYAISVYNYHFPTHKNYGDASTIDWTRIEDFDLLCGGFPCQSFSIAGKRKGFEDTRGTLFFEICRGLRIKRPKYILFENVKGLLSHENGRTYATIKDSLEELGYIVERQTLNSKYFGVPQNRERVFIAGYFGTECRPKIFPIRNSGTETTKLSGQSVGTIIARRGTAKADGDYVIESQRKAQEIDNYAIPILTPDRATKRQNGRRFKTNGEDSFTLTSIDRHGVIVPEATKKDSKLIDTQMMQYILKHSRIRRLTPLECERLQAFQDNWTKLGILNNKEIEISDAQRYKMIGNAVTTSVVAKIINQMKEIWNL